MAPTLANGVVTAACGRFHMFDQARELAAHGLLHTLITDYPRSHPIRFGIPGDKVRPFLANGVVKQGLARLPIPAGLQPLISQGVHAAFSKRLAMALPVQMKFFIGLSSFCLEALEVCRARGLGCAVDHGSLHQRVEKQLLLEEARRWGLPTPPELPPEWLIGKQEREYAHADHVFVLSRAAARSMVSQGVPEHKVFVNPCGVDVSVFEPGEKADDTFRVLQVGGISLRKGVPDLLEAFRMAAIPDSELCLVGGGFLGSGLERLIESYRALEVRIYEPVAQPELRRYYQSSSVFVLASIADGFGMVVPQAMACGLPVIVTENVGASDLVEDGVNGFIVPIRAPHLIAQRLRLLRERPGLASRMGQAAAQSVRDRHAWRHYGDALAQFLRSREASA